MYLWKVSFAVSGGSQAGAVRTEWMVTDGTQFDESLLEGPGFSGESRETVFLGYVPGIAPDGTIGVRPRLVYGVCAYSYPLLAESGEGLRRVITDWDRRLDSSVGLAFQPQLPIGPIQSQPTDPSHIGRFAALAAIPGRPTVSAFKEVMASEVFSGEVPADDVIVYDLKDASSLRAN